MVYKRKNEKKLVDYWKHVSKDMIFFEILLTAYGEKHRFYHTTDHILNLFHILDDLNLSISHKNKKKLYFAILFHDIVYDPKSKENEEKSNEAWILFAKENKIISEITMDVSSMILATKKHIKKSDFITNLFLDLDLSVLGSEPNDFNLYEKNIRLEYYFVPDSIYAIERSKVMKSLITEYYTYLMEEKFGKRRTENLLGYINFGK
jgi:predicted metal-dependent HD superfamily phosphohydrolase